MNNDQPINQQSQVTEQNSVNTQGSPTKMNLKEMFWNKMPEKVKGILTKISASRLYANKKIFWLITGAFSLVILTIILGLLFGSKDNTSQTNTKRLPSPTPQEMSQPTPEAKDALSQTDDRLRDIKNRINNLDVKVSKLSPPEVNFKVSF